MRRYCGVGALEGEHGMPAWERELDLAYIKSELEIEEGTPAGDPFAMPPRELEVLH